MRKYASAGAIFLLATAQLAHGQGATNVVKIERDEATTTIQPGQYYTRVKVDVPNLTVPSDDNGKKQWGKAILAAFGASPKSRSLTIALTLTYNGSALPTVPLVTYVFDGKKRLTDYKRVHSYISPAWQVGAATPIQAKLSYSYSEQTSFNPEEISGNITKVIPSGAIVSALSAPVIQSLAGLTTAIYNYAGSRSVNTTDQDDLLPFVGGIGVRALTFAIKTPSGIDLGKIKATLFVTPTLARPAFAATAAQAGDLERLDTENIADLAIDLGGTTKPLLADAKGLPQYVTMAKDRSLASVGDYCGAAHGRFSGYGLTAMDRTTVIYQSLLDAGFKPETGNAWLLTCFSQSADRVALTKAQKVSFTPIDPPVLDPSGTNWPLALKKAMGCWVTGQSGPYCKQNAPNARATLEAALTETIQVGVVDLAAIDTSTLPVGRLWTKAEFLNAVSGKADKFSCFQQGLILTAGDQAYTFQPALDGERIKGVQILKAGPDAAQCVG